MNSTSATTRPDSAFPCRSAAGSSRSAADGSLRSDRDWVGLWFKLLEEVSGEFIGMRAGRPTPGSGEIAWMFSSHATRDGLGWFAQLLRDEAGCCDVRLPQLKEASKPTLIARIVALSRFLARTPPPAAAWTGFDPSWTPPKSARAGTALATKLLGAERTRCLVGKARGLGVSLNSLLLSALARASEPELKDRPRLWMMPINMRGPVKMAHESANHTAFLRLALGSSETPGKVHDRVRAALGRREHWASWAFLNAGRLVGYRGMAWLYRRELRRTGGRLWTGAFSNLGAWNGIGTWFVCPPVALTCPVGVGVICCDERLSLTIEAHPSIAGGSGWVRTLLNRWLAELDA